MKLFLKIKIIFCPKSLWNSGAHYTCMCIILDKIWMSPILSIAITSKVIISIVVVSMKVFTTIKSFTVQASTVLMPQSLRQFIYQWHSNYFSLYAQRTLGHSSSTVINFIKLFFIVHALENKLQCFVTFCLMHYMFCGDTTTILTKTLLITLKNATLHICFYSLLQVKPFRSKII